MMPEDDELFIDFLVELVIALAIIKVLEERGIIAEAYARSLRAAAGEENNDDA